MVTGKKNMRKKSMALCVSVVMIAFQVSAESLVFPPYGHSHGIRKATQVHLFLFLPFAKFSDPQGLATAKMESRDDPSTEHDDDEVVVYGVNSGRHQLIYNTSMWGLASYGKKGSGRGEFLSPKGIACDPKGNVYVVDAGNNRIVHLFNPKKKVAWVKAFTGKDTGDSGLRSPMQVALDADGRIYVTDTGNRRMVIFDKSGKVVGKITPGGTGSFQDGPTTLAVADGRFRWSYYTGERCVFCADNNGKRLWKIDFAGNVEKTVAMPEGYHAFYGAVDYYHNFYVTDKHNHCILKFDHDLNLIDRFGSYGKGDNQFIEPRGITIWKRYGQTFVAEKGGAQYYWVGTELKAVGFWKKKTPHHYCIKTNVAEYCYISLFSVSGTDTITYMTHKFIRPGERLFPFKNEKISKAPDTGFLLRVEPTYSSYTYYHWDYPITLYADASAVPAGLPRGVFVKKKGTKGKKMTIDEMKRELDKRKDEE